MWRVLDFIGGADLEISRATDSITGGDSSSYHGAYEAPLVAAKRAMRKDVYVLAPTDQDGDGRRA